MKHQIKDELTGIALFVAAIWCVYLVDLALPADLTAWGILPRSLFGLVGIPSAPFLHAGLGHILSNTVPLVVLLILMAGSRARTWETVAEIVVASGALLWIIGRANVHVGASMLIYGLITFLIVAGFRERRIVSLLVALLVGFLYGTTLLFGVLPTAGPQVSWDGHLCGAIAGAAIAYFTVGKEDESNSPESTEVV